MFLYESYTETDYPRLFSSFLQSFQVYMYSHWWLFSINSCNIVQRSPSYLSDPCQSHALVWFHSRASLLLSLTLSRGFPPIPSRDPVLGSLFKSMLFSVWRAWPYRWRPVSPWQYQSDTAREIQSSVSTIYNYTITGFFPPKSNVVLRMECISINNM